MGDKYCYILDYSDSKAYKIILTEEDKKLNTEQLLDKYNLNIDTCCCMFSDNDLDNFIPLIL